MTMFNFNDSNRQVVKTISYAGYEKNVLDMEDALMKKYCCNRSGLHKNLVRDRFRQEMVSI